MEYLTLKDIALINMGQSPDSKTYNEEKEGIPFYQGKSDFGKINPIPRVWCSNPIKIAEKDDILISVRAPIGDTNIATEKCCIGRGLASIRPLNENINKKYLYYLLNSKYKELNKFGTGSTFKAITKENLCNLKCAEIPDIKEQIEVVKKLDNVSQIIEIKKKQLEKLSIIIKSQFVEMFENKNYEKLSGKELFSFSSGKFLEASKRLENGVPVYGGNGVAWYTDEPLIDFNTIVIGRVGAYCGNVKLIKEPVWITDNAIFIKQFKKDVYNIDFLYYMMELVDFSRFAQFSGQPKITQKPLEEFNYVVPPIEEQIKFSNIVKQIDKQKFEIENSLKEMQELYEALMERYFG